MRTNIPFPALALLGIILCGPSHADNRQWSFDQQAHPELSIMGGEPATAPGVRKQSLALDGDSILQVKDSAAATHHENGFTCAVWVNPYFTENGQQMIAAKNRYSLNEREWGVMIDKDGRYRTYVKQDGWRTLDSAVLPTTGKWQHVAVAISDEAATMWIDGQSAGSIQLDRPIPRTKALLTFGGVNDNGRIWQNLIGALDEAVLFDRALRPDEIAGLYEQNRAHATAAKEHSPPKREVHPLWSGAPIPKNPEDIPFAEGITHQTLHDARSHDYKFLHGAAIIHHKGTFFANWANSPKNENHQFETLQGRRSTDGGKTWSDVEMIGPGFEGPERHSHGVLFVHQGELWTLCARFGLGAPGRRFRGLKGEAFVLDDQTDRWQSRGIVMTNCWPYDEPVRMANGNFITGGQDKDGLPVVAISHGDDLTKWDSVLIPYDRRLQPSFAETTVGTAGERVIAVIRGGGGVAWVSTSDDFGRTWSKAGPSNLPMPRAKAYLGKLSTGQLYLVSNLKDRDTLVVSVGRPGESTLSSMWRIRHGKSVPPRFPGAAKSKQWSYPYGYEHAGKLYVVYSIGKEDCGLSIIPIESLSTTSDSTSATAGAAFTLEAQCPGVISDHAVFQQGIDIPIWGTSLPKAKVVVRFGKQSRTTVSDNDGNWRVALDPIAAQQLDSLHEVPQGRSLTIVTELDGERALKEFKDILVGEVWLCSGQSNMAGKVRHNHANQDPNDNLLESNFPAIRHISAPGGWRSAVPGSVGEFTRVGFSFARKVHREIKVPIGLVNACRGGSNIESWMRVPPTGLSDADAGKRKVDYGGLYRERLAPLVGYGIRGALWYQGEANASEGHSYFLKMESLLADWRTSWKLGDFPFYFVQLAGIGKSPTDNPAMGDGRARIREAQRRALTIENTGMAVAVDIGAEREHPANKVEVGERLACWALHHNYGHKEILPSGPLYKGCRIEGNTIRISFDHAQGLMLAHKKDYVPPVPLVLSPVEGTPEAKIPWLSIQAEGGTWHWAEGSIDGQDLIVSSKDVKKPVAVRYAYTNRPLGPYLYNKDGLPASPFRTEAIHENP